MIRVISKGPELKLHSPTDFDLIIVVIIVTVVPELALNKHTTSQSGLLDENETVNWSKMYHFFADWIT